MSLIVKGRRVAAFVLLTVSVYSFSAARLAAEDDRVLVKAVEGLVVVYLSEQQDLGRRLVPRVGDVLTPPLTILTSDRSRIDIQVQEYELSIAPRSSVLIPASVRKSWTPKPI